jgi:DNA-binding winged helix-turn-helix (wHTH) protein
MERQLLRRGEPVPLTPKAFDLLVLLVKNNGHLLTKDELMSALWPTAFVEEINLTQNISLIRKILGSSSSGDRLVETIPKQGYRFRASVRELPGTNGSVPLLEVPADKARWRGRLILAAVLAAGACLLLVWFGVTRLRGQRMHAQIAPQSLAVFPLLNLSGDPGQEYFADGMTDELTTELARSKNLFPRLPVNFTSMSSWKDRWFAQTIGSN